MDKEITLLDIYCLVTSFSYTNKFDICCLGIVSRQIIVFKAMTPINIKYVFMANTRYPHSTKNILHPDAIK